MDAPAIFLTAAVIIFMAALVAYRLRTPRSERLRQEIAHERPYGDGLTSTDIQRLFHRRSNTDA